MVKRAWERAGDILISLGACSLGAAMTSDYLTRPILAWFFTLVAVSLAILGLLCFVEVRQTED